MLARTCEPLRSPKVKRMSGSIVRVRDAAARDADAISALLADLGHAVPSADVPSRLSAVRQDHGAALVAVDDADRPLGVISLSRHVALHAPGPIAYITALVTSSAARRRGVGQLLVEAAKAWALEHGCVRLSVTSAERRADAHAFYPACGIPYTGRRFSMDIPGNR
jgi:GNAT superfamily N-acetyltransferase